MSPEQESALLGLLARINELDGVLVLLEEEVEDCRLDTCLEGAHRVQSMQKKVSARRALLFAQYEKEKE